MADEDNSGSEARPPLPWKQARENLETAIADILEAGGYSDGMVMDWVLVTAQHHITGGGDALTSYTHITRNEQPLHRTIGVLEMGLIKAKYKAESGMRNPE